MTYPADDPMTYLTDVRTLGASVREARRAQRLTQPDLATIANVGIRFIVDLENGKETCQIGLVLRVMRALGMRLQLTSYHLPGSPQPASIDSDLDFDVDEPSLVRRP